MQKKAESMARFKLTEVDLPQLDVAQKARLDQLFDTEINAAALSDPDNPPLTDEELSRLASARRVRAVRQGCGLTQQAFADRFHISVGRLRDLEQGRTTADSALLAYLAVIDFEPEAVRRALAMDAVTSVRDLTPSARGCAGSLRRSSRSAVPASIRRARRSGRRPSATTGCS